MDTKSDIFHHLIGECGEDYNGTNSKIVTGNLELGVSLLKQVLGLPPAQGKLEVLWANYDEQLFPTIAIAYQWEEGMSESNAADIAAYESRAERLLRGLNRCIDWGQLNLLIGES